MSVPQRSFLWFGLGGHNDQAGVRLPKAYALSVRGGMVSREGAERGINEVDVGQLGEVDSCLLQQFPALLSPLGRIGIAAPQMPGNGVRKGLKAALPVCCGQFTAKREIIFARLL